MRIVLDECVNAGVCEAFPGHTVKTVTQTGWRGQEDGPLLLLAEAEFDIFVTVDRSLEHQQNLERFDLGFVIVRVRSNEMVSYQPLFAQLKEAAESIDPGQVVHIGSPEIKRSRS